MGRKLKIILLIIIFVLSSAFFLYFASKNHVPFEKETDLPDDNDKITEDVSEPGNDAKDEKEIYPTPLQFISALPAAEVSDRVLSDAVYDENSTVAICSIPDRSILPDKAKYCVDIDDGNGNIVSETYFTLWPRMGFILLSDGEAREILAPDGALINVENDHYLSFASARTAQGIPVFLDCNTGKFVNLLSDGKIVECDYDEKRDFRGIVFDYPSYFGKNESDTCKVFYNGKRFGYTVEGEELEDVPASYELALNYAEGFGCAYDKDNRVYFFNEEGKLRIGGLMINANIFGSGDINDERALGYYYFDEGLTRVTKKKYQKGKLISEHQTFIDRKGNEFKTPQDYSIYSYSNGRILLVKDGKSGYMTSRGKWLSDPVFTYARPFFEGLAVVGEKDGKKGMIDRNGDYVIPPVFDEITDCSGGVIAVFDESTGWQVLNKQIPISR